MSQIAAVESQDPLTNMLGSCGFIDTLMTSPLWSAKMDKDDAVGMSHMMQVESPELVTILLPLSKNRQHDKYPSCAASSLCARIG
jgi:hypothetical protein